MSPQYVDCVLYYSSRNLVKRTSCLELEKLNSYHKGHLITHSQSDPSFETGKPKWERR